VLLSIITPTYRRPELLAATLHAVSREKFTDVEHIVVSDGDDPAVEFLCSRYACARYASVPHSGGWGCAARDAGVAMASGRYLAFWDDDNVYYDGAVATVRAAVAAELETGAEPRLLLMTSDYVHVQHRCTRLLPSDGIGLEAGFVDSSCLCLPAKVARQLTWEDGGGRCRDFRYAVRSLALCGEARVSPVSICLHIDSYDPGAAT
jgi:glycosyltransferase involved in cell wall biosynthesis